MPTAPDDAGSADGRAWAKGVAVTRGLLQEHGRSVPLFAGVEEWFDEIDAYGREKNLAIEHYVISSGILELIEGRRIYPRFRKVYASAYASDDAGRARWPSSAINYTNKTQFLFRINKGIDNVWDNSAINDWKPKRERPIPFGRMVFLGDGDTDIPPMKMVRQKGRPGGDGVRPPTLRAAEASGTARTPDRGG